MRKNKISLLITTVLQISGACMSQDWSKEFKIDKNTLLLAHYNRGLDADYALRNPASTGNVQLVDGKFGRGIYASNGILKQENLLGSPFFRMLRYSHVGNFNINQGTIEMWVKPSMIPAQSLTYTDPLDIADKADKEYDRYCLFHFAISPGNRQIAFYLRKPKNGETAELVFQEMFVRTPEENHLLETKDARLKKDQWYHVAVVWNHRMRAIFLNGKKIAERKADGPLPSFGPSARHIAIGSLATYSHLPAEATIDEVRISDIARY